MKRQSFFETASFFESARCQFADDNSPGKASGKASPVFCNRQAISETAPNFQSDRVFFKAAEFFFKAADFFSKRQRSLTKKLPSEVNFLNIKLASYFFNPKFSFQSASFLIFCPFLTGYLGWPIGPLLQIGNFHLNQKFPLHRQTLVTKKLTSVQ